MPDRVAMITGGTVGWDHFPFPVPLNNATDLTKEGFPVDLDRAMKWYWRVKKWHIEAYVEMSRGGGSDICSITADFDLSAASLAFGKIPKRESDLVIPSGLFQSFDDGGDNALIVSWSSSGMTKQTGDNFFYPVVVHAFNGANETAIQNTDRDLEEGGVFPDTAGDNLVTCDGLSNTGWYFVGSGGPLISGFIHITPTEFWPYAVQPFLPDGSVHPNAGLPIWDRATGIQLLDPITGFAA